VQIADVSRAAAVSNRLVESCPLPGREVNMILFTHVMWGAPEIT